MSESLELSVVIPTYNRRARLARVLEALDRQTAARSDFEVVVVDDGSADDTSAWLAAQRFSYELRSQRQENGGPARARNTGVTLARGRLLLFLDDDVVPEPELVAEHLASQRAEPNVAVIGPMVSLDSYPQPWVAWEQIQLEKQYSAMGRGDWGATYRQFWTGNASVPKASVTAAGGFDQQFLRAEDIELAYRMHQHGLGFRYNARARGLHHAERSLASWMNTQTSYGRLDAIMHERRGPEELTHILGGNWSRLGRSTRTLVQAFWQRPREGKWAIGLLQRAVATELARKNPRPTHRACSALASLLYWGAVRDAVGTESVRSIVERGDKMRASEG